MTKSTDNFAGAFNKAVTDYIQSSIRAIAKGRALGRTLHEQGFTASDFIGSKAPHRAALIAMIKEATVGKVGMAKLARETKAGKKADAIVLHNLRPAGGETITARQLTTQAPAAIKRIVGYINEAADPDAGKRGADVNKSRSAPMIHNETIERERKFFATLATTPSDQLTKRQKETLAAYGAKNAQQVLAGLNMAAKAIPAKFKK